MLIQISTHSRLIYYSSWKSHYKPYYIDLHDDLSITHTCTCTCMEEYIILIRSVCVCTCLLAKILCLSTFFFDQDRMVQTT